MFMRSMPKTHAKRFSKQFSHGSTITRINTAEWYNWYIQVRVNIIIAQPSASNKPCQM